jgi:predicted transcriptional regulator
MNELDYRTTRILKALGNPLRFRILRSLHQGPATPTELARALGRRLDAISRNLGVLRNLDLVWYHPRVNRLVYRVKHGTIGPFLSAAMECARAARVSGPAPELGEEVLL